MRALVQRVSEASVEVDAQVVGAIGRGLLVYVGVAREDEAADAERLAIKLRHLRMFPDEGGKLNLDVSQAGGEILLVSNFTLQADCSEGRRPSFTGAASGERADSLYLRLAELLRAYGLRVETGRFGALMAVSSCNDGPVNIILDSTKSIQGESNPPPYGRKKNS